MKDASTTATADQKVDLHDLLSEPTENHGKHLSREESIQKAIAALNGSDHHLILCLNDESPTKVNGIFAMYGNNRRILQTLIDALDSNPELSLIFRLSQLERILGE